jgi:hypothetical protein
MPIHFIGQRSTLNIRLLAAARTVIEISKRGKKKCCIQRNETFLTCIGRSDRLYSYGDINAYTFYRSIYRPVDRH